MILGASMALTEAALSPEKMAMFRAHNIDIQRIEESNSRHGSKAAPYLMAARATSSHLKEGDSTTDAIADIANAVKSTAFYYEMLLIGIIDGFTSNFNQPCRNGLAETVRNAFSVLDNIDIYNPTKIAKFTIANTGLTEATNMVFAYCDTKPLVSQFTLLADYKNWQQYITVGSRILGTLINTWGELMTCVNEGQAKGNGYDVGYCASHLASVLLDTSL